MNSSLDSFQSSYASVYQLNASVGVVGQDVNNVLNQFFLEPPTNLVRMIPDVAGSSGIHPRASSGFDRQRIDWHARSFSSLLRRPGWS